MKNLTLIILTVALTVGSLQGGRWFVSDERKQKIASEKTAEKQKENEELKNDLPGVWWDLKILLDDADDNNHKIQILREFALDHDINKPPLSKKGRKGLIKQFSGPSTHSIRGCLIAFDEDFLKMKEKNR